MRALLFTFVLVMAGLTFVYAQKPSADEIIAKHRASFGNADDIAKTKLRFAAGSGQLVIMPNRGPNTVNVTAYFASNSDDLKFMLTTEIWTVRKERIGIFSNKINIPSRDSNQPQGPLSDFLNNYDRTLTDRIFGGPVFSRWAFLSSTPLKGKFETEGKKRIGDRETWVVRYRPKDELTLGSWIKLYFDVDSFRLLRTEYRQKETDIGFSYTEGAVIKNFPLPSSPAGGMGWNGWTLIEDFSDYRVEAGVMLPHKYTLSLSSDSNAGTYLYDYSIAITEYKILNEFPADTFTFQTPAKTH